MIYMPKQKSKTIWIIIGIFLFLLIGIGIITFTQQQAFSSAPRLVYQYDKLGILNTTGINLDNVDVGKLTVIGCETVPLSSSGDLSKIISAKLYIGDKKLSEFTFPNRCIVNDKQQEKTAQIIEISLQKSYFTNPNMTIIQGSQSVDLINFQLIERVECMVDKDCASVRRLDIGQCNEFHLCLYSDIVRDQRENSKLTLWERIIIILRRLFNLKAI